MLPTCWTKDDETSQCRTAFLDFTFDFGITQAGESNKDDVDQGTNLERPNVAVTLGALLLLPTAQDGLYVKGSPLTMSELGQHAERISIDVESTDPEPMANSMAEALLEFSSHIDSAEPRVSFEVEERQVGSRPTKISIPLRYQDLHETGELIVAAAKSSNLDANAMTMLFANVVGNAQEGNEQKIAANENGLFDKTDISKEKSVALKQAFQKWWSEARTPDKTQMSEAAKDSGPQKSSNGENVVSEQSASTEQRQKDDSHGDTSFNNATAEQATISRFSKQDTDSKSREAKRPLETVAPGADHAEEMVKTRPGVIVARAAKNKRRRRGKVTYSKV